MHLFIQSKRKMKKKRAYMLTIIQFLLLFAFIFTGPVLPESPVALSFFFSGILLGIWAILIIGLNNLNVTPLPRENATLTQKGPYEVIRHPMYTAILLVTIPLTIENPGIVRIIVQLLLITDLWVKISFEENTLAEELPGYEEYRKKSWKIIPYII